MDSYVVFTYKKIGTAGGPRPKSNIPPRWGPPLSTTLTSLSLYTIQVSTLWQRQLMLAALAMQKAAQRRPAPT